MVPQRPFHSGDVTRRQLLISTGTFVAGGGIVAAAGSQPAKGAVSTTDLQIPPATHEGKDGSVADLTLEVVGNYEYRVPQGDTLSLALDVAPEDSASPDYQAIDYTEQSLATETGAGQYTLAGSLLDHPALTTQMFSAEPEKTVTHKLPVRVVMEILAGGESILTATAQTIASVEVTNTTVKASAGLIGEGQIAIEV